MEFMIKFKYTDKNTKSVNLAEKNKKEKYVPDNSTDAI